MASKNLKKLLALALALILALGLLSGCAKTEEPAAQAETPAAETPAAEADTAAARTDLIIAVDNDYDTLHPANWSTTVEQRLNSQIYDTLLQKSYADQNELEPRVAESWTISDDGLCYTFQLRQDVTFHNGTPLTAADIGFTLDMYAASEYQGAVVDGFDHYNIVDDYTIEVYTSSVYAPFLPSLASMFIASKDYYESAGEDDFAQKPVGCGPYQWVEHAAGNKVTLKAYDQYYRGAPAIQDVTFRIISNVTSLGMGVQTGEIDFAEIDPSVVSSLDGVDTVTVEQVKETTFGFVAMNTEKEPYSDVRFRQAVNYAIDRESIVAGVEEGYAVANSNLLTPERLGWSADQKAYSYDPEQAKTLLEECGAAGMDLGTMYVAEQYKLLAQVVQSNLEAVGLKCQIEVLEFNAYLDKLMQGDFGLTCLQMSLEGDTQQVSLALCQDYIGMANNARYANQEIDDLFAQAVEAIDEDARAEIYNQIFTKVQEEAVYAVLYNPTMIYAHSAALKVHTFPIEGVYYLYDFAW